VYVYMYFALDWYYIEVVMFPLILLCYKKMKKEKLREKAIDSQKVSVGETAKEIAIGQHWDRL